MRHRNRRFPLPTGSPGRTRGEEGQPFPDGRLRSRLVICAAAFVMLAGAPPLLSASSPADPRIVHPIEQPRAAARGPATADLSREELFRLFDGSRSGSRSATRDGTEPQRRAPDRESATSAAGSARAPAIPRPDSRTDAAEPRSGAATKPDRRATAGTKPANASMKKRKYQVVAGSFSTRTGAEQLASQLTGDRIVPRIAETWVDGRPLYRVIVGSYATLGEAKRRMAETQTIAPGSFCIRE